MGRIYVKASNFRGDGWSELKMIGGRNVGLQEAISYLQQKRKRSKTGVQSLFTTKTRPILNRHVNQSRRNLLGGSKKGNGGEV